MFQKVNVEQKHVIDRVVRGVQHHNTGSNVLYLTHVDCRKTFV